MPKEVRKYQKGGSESLRMRMLSARIVQEAFPEAFGFNASQRTYIAALLDRKDKSQEPASEDIEFRDTTLEKVMRKTRIRLGLPENAALELVDAKIQARVEQGRGQA